MVGVREHCRVEIWGVGRGGGRKEIEKNQGEAGKDLQPPPNRFSLRGGPVMNPDG